MYKRLLPVSVLNQKKSKIKLPADLRDEKELETFIDKLVTELVEQVRVGDEKCAALEKSLGKKEDLVQVVQKKSDEQASKLTRVIKEKENHYLKQKDSLVNYYEQLLNDVNSRVKVI